MKLQFQTAPYSSPGQTGHGGSSSNHKTPRPPKRWGLLRVLLIIFIVEGLLFGCGCLVGKFLTESGISPQQILDDKDTSPEVVVVAEPANQTTTQQPDPQVTSSQDWNLLLVNASHPLEETYSVPELVEVEDGHRVDSRIAQALQQMLEDARAAGFDPMICSSYRDDNKQQELYQNKVETYLDQGLSQTDAEQQAAQWVARPGTSEHETGLAVDLVDRAYQNLNHAQEQRPVQQWLMTHCAEYGFILRYPSGKSEITGIAYEPWHYRYVGVEVAQQIMSQGICLEEYLQS